MAIPNTTQITVTTEMAEALERLTTAFRAEFEWIDSRPFKDPNPDTPDAPDDAPVQTITDLDEVRPGDWVKAEYRCGGVAHPFEGEAWEYPTGALCVGPQTIRWEGGRTSEVWTRFVSATRPAPALPTEPGSVILASKVRGVELDPPVAMFRGHDDWWSPRYIDEYAHHGPEDVQEWAPAEVVAK